MTAPVDQLSMIEQAAREADAGGVTSGAAVDGGPIAPDPRAAQAAQIAAEISGLVQAVAMVFGPLLPSIAKIYTPATVQAIGQAVAPVCVKHGWSITGGKWAEEIGALAVLVPIGYATVAGVREDLAVMHARDVADAKPATGEAAT